MELPISRQSYLPSSDSFLRALKRVNAVLAATSAEETSIDGAVLFSHGARPRVACLNFASDVQAGEPAAARKLISDVSAHYRERGARCHWLESASQDWSPALLEALREAGAHASDWQLYVIDRPGPSANAKVSDHLQVIPARAAYAETRALFLDMAREEHGAEGDAAGQFADAMIDMLDEPRLDLFLARHQQRPVGVVGVVTLGNLGVLFPAFTPIAGRGKGVAGTLMQHVLDLSKRSQFEQLLIDRHDGCPAIPFYEKLGFKSVARFQRFHLPR